MHVRSGIYGEAIDGWMGGCIEFYRTFHSSFKFYSTLRKLDLKYLCGWLALASTTCCHVQ